MCVERRFTFFIHRRSLYSSAGAPILEKLGHPVECHVDKIEHTGHKSLCNHSGSFKLIGNNAVYRRLEEAEQRKPDPGSYGISLHQRLVVSERVIVEE